MQSLRNLWEFLRVGLRLSAGFGDFCMNRHICRPICRNKVSDVQKQTSSDVQTCSRILTRKMSPLIETGMWPHMQSKLKPDGLCGVGSAACSVYQNWQFCHCRPVKHVMWEELRALSHKSLIAYDDICNMSARRQTRWHTSQR